MSVAEQISPFMKQCFVTATLGLNIVGFGSVVGFPAILLPQLYEKESIIRITKAEESWIAAVLPLSLLTGSIITPPIMDRLGRKITHYALTLFFLIGWFITIMSTSVEALIIGRFCQGIGGGLLATVRAALIGEYTSPRNRGAFLTTVALTQAFGIFFVHLIGSLLSWQRTAFVCVFLHFVSLIMVIYTPESPSWLLSRGRHDECKEVFRWLRGNDEEGELEHMMEARLAFEDAEVDETNSRKWFRNFSVVRKKEFYKPIILAFHSHLLLHVSGATTMATYAIMIISLLMGPNANAHFWMVFVDTQRLIVNALAVYVINRTKRRTVVFSTGVWSVGCHFAIALYVYLRQNGWEYDAVWLPALLINFQFFAVAAGMVPMPQVIGGEIFPLQYRSIGGTITIATGGCSMFIVLKSFPYLIDNLGLHGTYTLYGFAIIVNLVIMMLWLPETKGKTLQQIEDELRSKSRIRNSDPKTLSEENALKTYLDL